jgi:hypothetical protein
MERKHRVVVEVTLDKACNEKAAVWMLKEYLMNASNPDLPWLPKVTHTKCKQFSLVVDKLEFIKS